jgi:hypothetical protein
MNWAKQPATKDFIEGIGVGLAMAFALVAVLLIFHP